MQYKAIVVCWLDCALVVVAICVVFCRCYVFALDLRLVFAQIPPHAPH